MTSKLEKKQLRRQRMKEQSDLLNAKRQLIRDAEDMDDLLVDIPMFKKFSKNGLTCDITCHKACPEQLKDWVFELTARHMKTYYDNTWGWSAKNKRKELFESPARYLIATCEDKPIGFIHIRFEFEAGEIILYVYELHVEDEFQGKGLGKWLMQAAEFIALKRKMQGVMLTVFKENVRSRQFYYNLKYKFHPSTPELCDPESGPDFDHEILHKSLVKVVK